MDTSNFQDLGENPTQNISNEFQAGEFAQSPLVSPVATLGAATTHYFPALRHLTTRALSYITADSSFVLHPALGVSFLTNQEATSFLTAFRAEHSQFNYSHTSVIKSVKVQAVQSMSEYKQDALDAKRYRWFKQQDFALFDVDGVFGDDDLLLNSDDLDHVIDKAMEVL